MKRILVFLLVLFVMLDVQGQRKKVGLVLSGGGAKGVAPLVAVWEFYLVFKEVN